MAQPNGPLCYYCEELAEAECTQCSRLYCPDHGDDICVRCASPSAAAPNATLYRGSLLALVIASLVILFLVVRPPESKSDGGVVRQLPTSTAAVSATATQTPPGGVPTTARPTGSAASTTPASGTALASPNPATTPSPSAVTGTRTYTVQPGDTLSAIAAANNTTVDAIEAVNPGLDPNLDIGTVITLP